ncbi:MAG: HEPN domain-containing protein [Bacillota bacterium]
MDNNRLELAKYWMEKAWNSFSTAKHEFNRDNIDFCVNRLYYAVFYAVSSVLVIKGKSYNKHSAVRVALHREFVKSGIIPIEYGKLYDALLQDREEADYVAFVDFDPGVIKEELKQTEEFIILFKKLLNEEIDNQ